MYGALRQTMADKESLELDVKSLKTQMAAMDARLAALEAKLTINAATEPEA
jgi:chaperonin cofactor prefoldin